MTQQNNNSFEVDYKFNAKDLLLGAENVVGKLPIKYIGEEEVYGDWVNVFEVDGKKINIKLEDSVESLFGIMELINNNLPDKNTKFEYVKTGGENHSFKLVSK